MENEWEWAQWLCLLGGSGHSVSRSFLHLYLKLQRAHARNNTFWMLSQLWFTFDMESTFYLRRKLTTQQGSSVRGFHREPFGDTWILNKEEWRKTWTKNTGCPDVTLLLSLNTGSICCWQIRPRFNMLLETSQKFALTQVHEGLDKR